MRRPDWKDWFIALLMAACFASWVGLDWYVDTIHAHEFKP